MPRETNAVFKMSILDYSVRLGFIFLLFCLLVWYALVLQSEIDICLQPRSVTLASIMCCSTLWNACLLFLTSFKTDWV